MADMKATKDEEMLHLDLSPIRRRKICIDDDVNRILELNTTDMGIVARLNDFYPKLEELQREIMQAQPQFDDNGEITDESFLEMGKFLKDIDAKMRMYIDKIFDANVSELCAPSGNMFDPINGKFRYEYIIDILTQFYEEELEKNIERTRENVKKHTAKYKGNRKKN